MPIGSNDEKNAINDFARRVSMQSSDVQAVIDAMRLDPVHGVNWRNVAFDDGLSDLVSNPANRVAGAARKAEVDEFYRRLNLKRNILPTFDPYYGHNHTIMGQMANAASQVVDVTGKILGLAPKL